MYWGVPEKLLFLLLRAAVGGARGETEARGTPAIPVKGWPPLKIPLLKVQDRTTLPAYLIPSG